MQHSEVIAQNFEAFDPPSHFQFFWTNWLVVYLLWQKINCQQFTPGKWSGPEWAEPGGGGVSAKGHTYGWGCRAAGHAPGGSFPPSRSGTFACFTLHRSWNILSTLPVSITQFTSWHIYSPPCMDKYRLCVCVHAYVRECVCVCSCAVTSAVNPHSECHVVFSFPS